MIRGPVPMCLVDKPETGTGATLMLQCVGWVLLGEELPEVTWSSVEEEQRKHLTTLLMRGRPLVNLDNINYLYSRDLLSVLTGSVREDRRLGGNELLTIPNRSAFVGSGNNVGFDIEHAGRLYLVRLDAGVENPRTRDVEFKHPDLMAWTQANRPALVAALLTLIQAWIAEGRPAYSGKRMATFEAWSNVIGGILEHAGVPGFLANRDSLMNRAQGSSDENVEFLTEWLRRIDAKPSSLTGAVKTKELYAELAHVVPEPRRGSERSPQSLGRYLEQNVDKVRVLDCGTTVAIRRAPEDKHGKVQRWSLAVLRRGDGQVEPDDRRGKESLLPEDCQAGACG
jgi:hypothetical protein